jgi:O-antigen/teichoic acid export membrane protein
LKSMRERLLAGTLFISAARILTNLLGVLSTLALARLLVPADFGLVALATSMLAILTSVTEISLSEALVQHKNPTADHFHTVWTMGVLRSAVIAVLFASAAWGIARIYSEPRLINVVFALSLSVLISGAKNPRSIMLTRELVFWQLGLLQVAERLIGLVVAVGFAYVYRSYWALILGSVAGQLASVVLSYFVLPFRPKFGWRHTGELFSFSIWLTFCQVINTINWKFDQLLVGLFFGKTDLGYYTVGDNLASLPTRESIAPLTTALFPALVAIADSPSRLAAGYQSAQALATSVALPLGIGVAMTAETIIRLAMGEKWLPAAFVIQILASVFALQTIGSLAQGLAMAVGATKLLFRRDLQGFLMRVPLILAGVYLDGFRGVVYARVFSGTIIILFNMILVKSITGLSIWQQLRPNLRTLICVGVMAAALAATNMLLPDYPTTTLLIVKLLALTVCGTAVYSLARVVSWIVVGPPRGPETELAGIARKLIFKAA